jgi:hypothetical protein
MKEKIKKMIFLLSGIGFVQIIFLVVLMWFFGRDAHVYPSWAGFCFVVAQTLLTLLAIIVLILFFKYLSIPKQEKK